MNNYDNTNSGAIFTNKKKAKDSDPLYRGSVDVEGVEYWVSSWVNISKAGEKYMSLKLTKKDEQKTQQGPEFREPAFQKPAVTHVENSADNFDEDSSIPF